MESVISLLSHKQTRDHACKPERKYDIAMMSCPVLGLWFVYIASSFGATGVVEVMFTVLSVTWEGDFVDFDV